MPGYLDLDMTVKFKKLNFKINSDTLTLNLEAEFCVTLQPNMKF